MTSHRCVPGRDDSAKKHHVYYLRYLGFTTYPWSFALTAHFGQLWLRILLMVLSKQRPLVVGPNRLRPSLWMINRVYKLKNNNYQFFFQDFWVLIPMSRERASNIFSNLRATRQSTKEIQFCSNVRSGISRALSSGQEQVLQWVSWKTNFIKGQVVITIRSCHNQNKNFKGCCQKTAQACKIMAE